MGWAKYQEDIVSRWVNDNYGRRASAKPRARAAAGRRNGAVPKQEKQMSKLKEFTVSTARPLPVIVLADVSGSMSANGKIDALNDAVSEMIANFAEEDDSRAEIHVGVIAFGGAGASLHKHLRPAGETQWESMQASGRTPMGEAFALVRSMIEDRNTIPSRAYRPTVVLVSDGVPTDDWRGPLKQLLIDLIGDRTKEALPIPDAVEKIFSCHGPKFTVDFDLVFPFDKGHDLIRKPAGDQDFHIQPRKRDGFKNIALRLTPCALRLTPLF